MNVSATRKTDSLIDALSAKGLTTAKAKLVETELKASIKTVASRGGSVDKTAVRAALDQRIAADVASGKLTQKDADAVKATLDHKNAMGTTEKPAAAAGGKSAPGGAGGGAGGSAGGGSAASKTELSRSVVVTGAIETITITYTDGTVATETEAATSGTAKTSGDTASASTDAGPYAEKIPPGSLVDQTA